MAFVVRHQLVRGDAGKRLLVVRPMFVFVLDGQLTHRTPDQRHLTIEIGAGIADHQMHAHA